MARAARILVHHLFSPAMQAMLESVLGGARTDEIDGVQVAVVPALTGSPVDVLGADGYLLGTPANIGYMSGALKHFFDGIYYPCLEATRKRPTACTCTAPATPPGRYARWSRFTAGLAGAGPAAGHWVTGGQPGKADLEACWELGAPWPRNWPRESSPSR